MKDMRYYLFALLAVFGCGKKRPIHHVVDNELRIEKSALAGEFYFLKTVTKVDTPGLGVGELLFPGTYLEQGNIVKFTFKEHRMEVVATENPLDSSSPRTTSAVLASFPIDHVDILWQKNADDKDTRNQEETVARNTWENRGYVVIDVTNDTLDQISQGYARTTAPVDRIDYDPVTKSLTFELEKNLTDGTVIRQKYSFMMTKPSSGYEPKEYSINEKQAFGFFDTVSYTFNDYGRVTDKELKRYLNRWKSDEDIIYFLSSDYPENLMDATKAAFDSWNDVFEEATGRRPLQLKANAGEEMGDMRYNMIAYVDDASSKSILGYGPSYSDPKTGQILKADVFLYGATLKNAIYGERKWIDELGDQATLPTGNFPLTPTIPETIDDALNVVDPQNFVKLKKAYALDEELIAALQKNYGPVEKVLDKMRTPEILDFRRITKIDGDALHSMRQLALAGESSDEELEVKIFGPLLAHEMGHNFGLRHNFMGSADSEYQDDDHISSSVMDYTFLTSKSDGKPGAYDSAAVAFGYGNDEKRAASLEKSYLYCTDEDLLTSRTPLCAQFDWGATLTAAVENQFDKYSTSYKFNNLRGDRAFFHENTEGYINSVFASLVPFRLAIDNANAIAEMVNSSYEAGTPGEVAVFTNLWQLLGKRIEADSSSSENSTVEVEISDGVNKKIDIAKILAAAGDAERAKSFAVDALTAVIAETSRPNYSSIDPLNRQLGVRGVLLDKLIALIILAEDTPDPLGRGATASAFTDKEQEIGSLFVQIIANSRTTKTGSQLAIWDVNLRKMALNLLQQLTQPGKETSEMIELLSLLELKLADLTVTEASDYHAIYDVTTGHDDKIRGYVVQSLDANVTQTQIDTINTNIQTERTARNLLNFAAVKIKDREFKTPITLDIGGLKLTSATGLLIRDAINQLDVRVSAYQQAIATLTSSITAEPDAGKKANVRLLQQDYQQTMKGFRRFVNQEKRFVEEIYSIYHPNR